MISTEWHRGFMIYLIDANVMMDANRNYYPMDMVPQYWGWLMQCGLNGSIKIPLEVLEEVKAGTDKLADWAKTIEVKEALMLDEEADIEYVRRVINEGYVNDPTDDQIQVMGKDPFLISYALSDPRNKTVVTTERSKPRRQAQNRHVPDVCNDLGISCINAFELNRVLGFSTK